MSFPRGLSVLIAGCGLWLSSTGPGWSQAADTTQAEGQTEEVAQQLTNPIAHLFAIPLELQYEAGAGAQDGTRMTLTQLSLIHRLDRD
jgi:hypothetical protein